LFDKTCWVVIGICVGDKECTFLFYIKELLLFILRANVKTTIHIFHCFSAP